MTAVDDAIREITASIWETLFTLPLEAVDDADAATVVREPTVTGCVTIEGAWHGAVLLSCERALGERLAGQLFRSSSASTEEVRDTVGELTNMLAGNLKALLPDPSRISLPAVAVGGDYDLSVVGTEKVSAVRFRCDGAHLEVSLHEGQAKEGS